MSDFDCLKINGVKEISHLSDFELVRAIQEETDKNRAKHYWECPRCGFKLNYVHSLLCEEKTYIHEYKCTNELKKPEIKKKRKNPKNKVFICNTKMRLVGGNSGFDSIYFSELFHRYQHMIYSECQKYSNIEQPDELYSLLLSSFLKITLQFVRDPEMDVSIKGEKWFSTFFWIAIRNRIFDVQKTNNYNKRNPLITCLICGDSIAKITGKHLMEPGHEIVTDEALYYYGKNLGMDGFSKAETIEYVKRIYAESKKERSKIEFECMEEYTRLFSNCYVKNGTMSINDKMCDNECLELSDNISESENFDENREMVDHRHVIEDIDLKDKIRVMSEIIVKEESIKVEDFFEPSLCDDEKIKIVYGIIHKMILNDIPVEVNQYYDLIDSQNNFNSEIIDILRKNAKCRMLVGKESLEEEEEVSCSDDAFSL